MPRLRAGARVPQRQESLNPVIRGYFAAAQTLQTLQAMKDPPVFSRSSKGRLTDRDLGRFPGDTLFDRLARAVCHAGCLPRKELYEAWEVARRVRRLFRGGRVVDLGGGHGLLAHVMLLLDDSSPDALVVDKTLPASSATLHEALVQAWPRLAGRVGVCCRRDRARRDCLHRRRCLEPCLRRSDRRRARARRFGSRACRRPAVLSRPGRVRPWRADGMDRRPAGHRPPTRAGSRTAGAIGSGRRPSPPTSRRRTAC